MSSQSCADYFHQNLLGSGHKRTARRLTSDVIRLSLVKRSGSVTKMDRPGERLPDRQQHGHAYRKQRMHRMVMPPILEREIPEYPIENVHVIHRRLKRG
jgi:hypothetical protein